MKRNDPSAQPTPRVARLRELIATGTAETPRPSAFMRQVIVSTQPHELLAGERHLNDRQRKINELINAKGGDRPLGALASRALMAQLDALRTLHPNFGDAIDHVVSVVQLARTSHDLALTGLRLLLVGPPGVGKTHFAHALSEILRLPFVACDMAAAQSGAHLGGSEEFWGNTQPGQVWRALVQGDCANPLFVLDELDKADATRLGGYDPRAALYSLLEPVGARRFRDRSVPWMEIDASRINWIATANTLARIDAPLRSRFTVVEILPATPAQQAALVQSVYRVLIRDLRAEGFVPDHLDPAMTVQLMALDPRSIQRALRAALAEHLDRQERTQPWH